MKHLKRLGLAFTLMSILAVTAFGDSPCAPGQTGTPPCACAPGETQGPPCSSQVVNDDSTDPGQTSTPPAAPVVNVTDIAETVLWALSLF